MTNKLYIITPDVTLWDRGDVEVAALYEDEDGNEFWWKQCEADDCSNRVCLWASKTHCYPHSAWWRPYTRYINRLLTWIGL